jgi:nucleosome assembly protein 1-like 1
MSLEHAKEVMASIENLRKLDDTYCQIESELRGRILAIRKEFQSKFDTILNDRAVELSRKNTTSDDAHATPAIPGFWLDVLANSEEFNEDIEEYDEEILDYLENIEAADIDPSDEDKGFILTFRFNENPFFTNKELRKVYTTARVNTFTDQLEIVKIESDKIDWKEGKDVTVEAVAKKKSGGGRKKKGGVKVQPRPSFFRFFRDLDQDNLPSDFGGDEEEEEDYDEEQDELERLQMVMEHDWDRANTLKELIIPRAIRWYTGEAVQAFEDDGDDEEDEEEEDEESEESSSEEGSPKAGKKNLFAAQAGQKNPEECKQQ